MAVFRLSYFWESVDNEGWSENFYWDGSSLSSAQTFGDNFASQLAQIRCDKFRMVDARYTDISVRGSVLFTKQVVPLEGVYTPEPGATPLEVNTSLNVELLGIAPRFMRWNCRGLTSDVIVGREYVKPPAWNTSFNTILLTLTAGAFQTRHRVGKVPPFTYEFGAITETGRLSPSARKPGRPFGLLVGRRTKPGT